MKRVTGTSFIMAILSPFTVTQAWQMGDDSRRTLNRRQAMIRLGTAAAVALIPSKAQAGIDPSLLKSLPVQGDESGAVQRLRQVEAVQRPSTDLVDVPFTELSSGVSFREYREGKGEAGN